MLGSGESCINPKGKKVLLEEKEMKERLMTYFAEKAKILSRSSFGA